MILLQKGISERKVKPWNVSVKEFTFSKNVNLRSATLKKIIFCTGFNNFLFIIWFLTNLGTASFRKICQCLLLLFFANIFLREPRIIRFVASVPGYFSSFKFVEKNCNVIEWIVCGSRIKPCKVIRITNWLS